MFECLAICYLEAVAYRAEQSPRILAEQLETFVALCRFPHAGPMLVADGKRGMHSLLAAATETLVGGELHKDTY
jgi:hypothetical protein